MTDVTNLGLGRVERDTVQERVYVALRDKLMRGGFAPGQAIASQDRPRTTRARRFMSILLRKAPTMETSRAYT